MAKALRFKNGTLSAVGSWHRHVSRTLAVRVAKFAKVAVDDVLSGRYPAPGACPMCGHGKEKEEHLDPCRPERVKSTGVASGPNSMNDDLKAKALADIDRVLAYQPPHGGTGAVVDIASSIKACIQRWTTAGSSYRKMAECIDPFPQTKPSKVAQHTRALMTAFRRDVEAGLVELAAEPTETVNMNVNDELRELNGMARRLLAYLLLNAVKGGGRPFTTSPDDPAMLSHTSLNREDYMKAATWLIRKRLAKWLGSGGVLLITDYGIQVAENDSLIDRQLPFTGGVKSMRNEGGREMDVAPDKKKVFVIHGRNTAAQIAVEHFLKALKLEPLDFDQLAADSPSEFVGNIVLEGMKRAHGIVSLFTPDESAALWPPLRGTSTGADILRWQSRPNVLFEAGIAFGSARNRTVLVTLGQDVSLFSDVTGIHTVRLNNSVESRNKFRQKLIGVGCDLDQRADAYLDSARAGDFDAAVAGLAGVSPLDPFRTAP